MIEWHHKLNRHEFEQTPGNNEGQESLACYSPSCQKELDVTEQLTKQEEGGEGEDLETMSIKSCFKVLV